MNWDLILIAEGKDCHSRVQSHLPPLCLRWNPPHWKWQEIVWRPQIVVFWSAKAWVCSFLTQCMLEVTKQVALWMISWISTANKVFKVRLYNTNGFLIITLKVSSSTSRWPWLSLPLESLEFELSLLRLSSFRFRLEPLRRALTDAASISWIISPHRDRCRSEQVYRFAGERFFLSLLACEFL